MHTSDALASFHFCSTFWVLLSQVSKWLWICFLQANSIDGLANIVEIRFIEVISQAGMAVKYLLNHRLASVSKPASEHSTSIDGIRLKCGDFHLYIAFPYGLYTSTLINSSCSIYKMIKAVVACAMFDFPRYASHRMHRKKIYIILNNH